MKLLYIHTGRVEEHKANTIQVVQMCSSFASLGVETVLAVNSYLGNQATEAAKCRIRELAGKSHLPFHVRVFRGSRLLGRFRSIGCIKPVHNLCRELQHDIVFVRDPVLMPFLKPAVGPFVFESHNSIPPLMAGGLGYWWQKRIVEYARNPKMALFVAISNALANWWKDRGVPFEKILAAHDAVDPTMFQEHLQPAEARKCLGLSENRRTVVYAGSLYSDRSIPDILRLADRRKDALFVIVGGPDSHKRRYEAKARKLRLDNVIFVGQVPFRQVPLYLAAADVLLMLWSSRVPTIRYCSPLKIFEYMAAGRTIVGHRFPTVEEVLEHRREALLADPENFQELAQVLSDALDRPDPQMATRAREKAISLYTWQERCRQILQHLKEY